MRYAIVGIIKEGKTILGYEALPITKDILELKAKPVFLKAKGNYDPKKIEFANAEVEKGEIKITIGALQRYPQFDKNKVPIPTKYHSAYKVILIGRCAVNKSGKLKEGIVYINGKLKAYSYEQFKELKKVLAENNGCMSNATIRDNGTPEITTWNLTNEQRKKALFIYAKPVLPDLVKANSALLHKVYEAADTVLSTNDETSARQADSSQNATSTEFDNCLMRDGVLIRWTGDKVNPVIPEGVTELGDNLFANNFQIKSVVLPSTLKKINTGAFMGCIELEKVQIDKNNIENIGNTAFFGTRKLKSYSLSPKTEVIGDYAFCGSGLEKIDLIMPYVKQKGKFYKAGSGVLADEGNFGETNMLENEADGDTEVIKDINIGYGAFAKNYRLTSVEFICDKPLNIGDRAFEDCGELRTIKGDYLVKSIGDSAFEGTSELKNVNIDNIFNPLLEHIGDRAFRNSNISGNIKLYNVKSVGMCAFESVALDNVTIYTENLEIIKDRAFEWSGVRRVKFIADRNLVGVKQINLGQYCFADCDRLIEVDIHKGIDVVGGKGVFSACANLDIVNLGDTSIVPHSAFLNCEALSTIDITDVKEVRDMAFAGTGLRYVITDATKIGAYAFSKTPLQKFVGKNVGCVGDRAFASCSMLNQCKFKEGYTANRSVFQDTPLNKRLQR